MSIVTLIIALVLAFIAFKVLSGILKIGAILGIILIAGYLYSQGYLT
ncbi:hypothetical protein [Altererythrobacter aquiaggeris]